MRLDAPKREGFVRRFVLNDPARIKEMQELGYDYAQEKAGEGDKRTAGQGTRITRHAGSDNQGRPQQLVLMETPVAEYQAGRAEQEAHLKQLDDAIRRGADTTGNLREGQGETPAYRPSVGSSISHTG